MASSLVVPFNFQPTAVSVKTGSYTIPAGSYARVIVNLEGSATFTIGGVTALRGTQNSVLASDNLSTQSVDVDITGNVVNRNQLGVYNESQTAGGSGWSANGGAFNEETDQKTVIAELWLPTGVTIDGTGTWRAVVMLYNEIT